MVKIVTCVPAATRLKLLLVALAVFAPVPVTVIVVLPAVLGAVTTPLHEPAEALNPLTVVEPPPIENEQFMPLGAAAAYVPAMANEVFSVCELMELMVTAGEPVPEWTRSFGPDIRSFAPWTRTDGISRSS